MDRFWSNVEKTDGCWVYTGTVSNSGYGILSWKGRTIGAHVYAYIQAYGPVPAGLELDHSECHNRLCVNPAHLEAVTHLENCARRAARVTECPQGHEYSVANTRWQGTNRKCRQCDAARSRRRRALKTLGG